jgi:nucleoside-diphosphate-sugar epimerase
MIEANFSLGVLVLEAATAVGLPRLLYTGSFFQHSGSPPGTPRNLYAALKNAFEEVLHYYGSTGSIDAVSLTLGDVYGEDDPRPRVLNTAVASAVSGAVIQIPEHDPFLVPVHIDDVTAAVATVMSKPFANRTFWVGPGAAVRLSEVLATIAGLVGATLRTEQADIRSLPGDTLAPPPGTPPPGWSPLVTLEEGIRRMIGAYRVNGEDRR